jgi:glycosyltransferase involved in cell wall biosynthesis
MNAPIASSQKRITIFLPGMYEGGAERVMLNLAVGFVQRGFAVDLVMVQAEGPYMREIPDSIRVVELNKKHRSAQRTLSSLPALVRYVRRERPEVMLSCLNYANVIALWAKLLAGVPFRLSVCEQNTFSSERAFFPGYLRWLLQTSMRVGYPRADEIIAVSQGVADDLANSLSLPRRRIRVIYNPIITPELEVKRDTPLEDAWFGEGQPPVILAIGRLTEQKAFDILLQAFAKVHSQRPIRLIILGEGEDRPALETLVNDLDIEDDVRLPGFVTNPYQYLAKASLFVLSSRWEGLPTVLVEALYCGAALVSTDCPSGPREILKGGQYGKLVPVDNPDALAEAIQHTLENPIPPPDPSSWHAFELATIIQQYETALFGK